MNGSHWHLLQQLLNWLDQGIEPWLATVLKTYGSAPRPAGSLMMYHPQKGIVGSLSGGCVEQELTQQLSQQPPNCPTIIRYGSNLAEQQRLQLPCGGHLDVLLEKINPDQKSHFQQLYSALEQRRHIIRQIDLNNGTRAIINDKKRPENIQHENNIIQHALSPHDKLLMIGAGEVARCVAEIAKHLEFEITLCDFRDEFLQGWQVDGVTIVKGMPDDLIAHSFNDVHCAIIALAHDPRIDDMAILEALTSKAFYIGAMGSMKTSEKRRKRLQELGIKPSALEKLHAPVGLDIGSKTPYEIALSIMAHVVRHRRNKTNEFSLTGSN